VLLKDIVYNDWVWIINKKYNKMNEQEMREYLKDKSEEEIKEFIIDRLKKICEQGEKLSVEDEDYERAGELLKIKNRLKC